ncbi:hypothetical protein GIB67_030234 [Kingdonia uniflora]|uniref:MULE transposase domain-containing protein n=1 Tax=Kingdonia uniflora TaxID=39325 RepID=A0A7J7MMY8_9MAGN|nr:hypothetical protein GIB67_030234 [Kingdonia uniflora]
MVMIKASYDGSLRGCRPVLGLDECFLKGKYGGVCLSIIELDGNNGLFSVATYFCRIECYDDTWNKFLRALQPWLDQHDAKLTFIFYRQKGLIKAVADNFHHYNHRFYFRRMYKNFNKICKGTHLEKLSWNAVRAYITIDKDNFLAKLGEDHLSARHWLERKPPKTWCRSHFDSTAKCEHITNNFCESFNYWILRVRDKPLHKSLQKLNMMMMTLMYDRRTKTSIWDQDGLVPRAVAHIAKLKKWYGKFDLAGVDKNKWTATKDGQRWAINLDAQECEYKEWQVPGLPCVYAVSILIWLRKPSWKKYCSEYHWVSTYIKAYASTVYPPPREFRPPPLLRPIGRPRKSRRKDEDELTNGSARRCGKCGYYRHNKKTCKGPPVVDKVVYNKKKLTRVDTLRSQEEIKVKFGFSTLGQRSAPKPSTTTSQTTQTCKLNKRLLINLIIGQDNKIQVP